MIKHDPTFDVEKVCAMYSEKDGVPVKYVLTTEIKGNNMPCDVFYRDTPHPEFGNKYFALVNRESGVYIMDADDVEEYEISMIADSNGDLYYSRYRHDFVSIDTGFIDGGRAYTRGGGTDKGGFPLQKSFKVVNGELVESV